MLGLITNHWRILCRVAYAPGLVNSLLACAIVVQAAAIVHAATVAEVVAAWEKRKARITSVQYECDLDMVLMVSPSSAEAAIFGNQSPIHSEPTAHRLPSKMRFGLAGKKIAYRKDGDNWDYASHCPRHGLFQAAFDGRQFRTLHTGADISLGRIDKNGRPGLSLTVETTEVAFYLGYDPVGFLTRVGCDVKQMEVRCADVDVDGRSCIELSLPRKVKSPWFGLIYVDAARDFVPVRWLEQYDGLLMHEASVKYVSNDKCGFVPSAWTHKQFKQSGDADNTMDGKVTKAVVNEAMDDEAFTLAFPVGAHVAAVDGAVERHYKQGEGGLIPISDEEYGNKQP